MAQFLFSSLTANQHLVFDPEVDVLRFGGATDTAGAVRLTVLDGNLGFTFGGKTVWLDGVNLGQLAPTTVSFANGSQLAIGDGTAYELADWYGQDFSSLKTSTVGQQVWGLGGADLVQTGSGADWLVGNVALAPLQHVSRVGNVGAPTATNHPTISADGNLVAFEGGWTAFGSSSDSGTDVFVKNLATGAVTNQHEAADGTNGLSGSGSPVISADGSVVAFLSASDNLLPDSGSGALYDIFVADVVGGGIVLASTSSTGAKAANGRCLDPDVSGDGRYVAFTSDTSNFAANTTNNEYDVFVKDLQTGALVRASHSLTNTDGNGESIGAAVSADGELVAFESTATNLSAGDTNGQRDIFVWQRSSGAVTNLTEGGNGTSRNVDVAYDAGWGGYAVFESSATNLIAGKTTASTQIFAADLFSGGLSLVSTSAAGVQGNLASDSASISGDGRFVVFRSYATNLVAGDTNGYADIFVKDTFTGRIARVSVAADGTQSNQHSGNPTISLGGEWIVFESGATNLAGTDANGTFDDVFRVANPLLQDTLIGGAGNDTYVLQRADVVTEALNGGIDTVRAGLSYTLGAHLENLVLTGTASINGTGNALNNVITGNVGSNTINGSTGIDTASYEAASAAVTVDLRLTTAQATGAGSDRLLGIEYLTGSRFNDRLTGNDLANRLDGGAGNDTLTGGLGNDTYLVDSSADIIVEAGTAATEIDTVVSTVAWTLGARLENLVLTGTAAINGGGNNAANLLVGNGANNQLYGYGGNDTLNGGAGNDTLTGSTGSDTYIVDSSADVTVEAGTDAGAIDTVISGVSWILQSTLENLTLTGTVATVGGGNGSANVINGNAANNVLGGYAGVDTIDGGAGNDTISGGADADRLTGGSGSDRFVFNSKVGADVLIDFVSGTDRLAFSQSALRVGDGDLLLEGSLLRAAPGGFATSAELVVFTTNVASLTTAAAAAAIGSATGAYAVGQTALFAVDTGVSTGVYLFTSSGADAAVSAAELTLLGSLGGTASTVLADYQFVA